MTYPNIVYHRGKQYSYFEIELSIDVSIKYGSLYPHYSSQKWKNLLRNDFDYELKFENWTMKVVGNKVFFCTSNSELVLDREKCKDSFLKASGDSLYFCNDIPYLT